MDEEIKNEDVVELAPSDTEVIDVSDIDIDEPSGKGSAAVGTAILLGIGVGATLLTEHVLIPGAKWVGGKIGGVFKSGKDAIKEKQADEKLKKANSKHSDDSEDDTQ